MTEATTVLMNPNLCGGDFLAATLTQKNGPRKSFTGRAESAVLPFLRKPLAVAPRDETKAIPAGNKTTNGPAAWPASGQVRLAMSVVPTLAQDGRIETKNAVAADPWDVLSVLQGNPLPRLQKMPPSPQAAVQRRTVAAAALTRVPLATPGVPPHNQWPQTALTATANLPAARGHPPADRGTTILALTTEPIASPAAHPACQPGTDGLHRSQSTCKRIPT